MDDFSGYKYRDDLSNYDFIQYLIRERDTVAEQRDRYERALKEISSVSVSWNPGMVFAINVAKRALKHE